MMILMTLEGQGHSPSIPSSFTFRLVVWSKLLRIAIFGTVQQFVKLLRTHSFQLLLKFTAILSAIWFDTALGLALILAHEFTDLRGHLIPAMRHIWKTPA
jgi:hypothetical protein